MKKEENLKSEFIKTEINPINIHKLLERLAENKNNTFDEDLVGKVFLDQIQKEREYFISGAGKPRKKNCKCYLANSISMEDLQKARDKPGPSNEKHRPKKRKIIIIKLRAYIYFLLQSSSTNNDVKQ